MNNEGKGVIGREDVGSKMEKGTEGESNVDPLSFIYLFFIPSGRVVIWITRVMKTATVAKKGSASPHAGRRTLTESIHRLSTIFVISQAERHRYCDRMR